MTKVTSKLLTFLLSFAMVFTSIGWLGAGDVNAIEGDNTTLTVKVEDTEGQAKSGITLSFKTENDVNDIYLEPSDENGIATVTLDGEENYPEEGEADLEIFMGDETAEAPEIVQGVKVVVGHDSAERPIFTKVNDFEPYNGETVTLKIKAEEPVDPDDPTAGWTTDFDFNDLKTTGDSATEEDKAKWAEYGIDYYEIDLKTDLIVDVRNTDNPEGAVTYVDFTKDPHFVYSNSDAVNVTNGPIVAGDEVAQKLDDRFAKANPESGTHKRIVIICYAGQTMAKRAMQYYNTQGKNLGPEGDVTYLIGGANGVLAGNYKLNLGIGTSGIDMNKDTIIDVRAKASTYDAGHILGAVNVDVTDEGGVVSDADAEKLEEAIANRAEGGHIVIVCNSGNALAYRTMEYYVNKYKGTDTIENITYLINGAKELKNSVETEQTLGKVRERSMTTEIDMSKYPEGEAVQVWVPVPQTDEYQTISNEKFDAPKATVAEFTTEEVYGNKMLYLKWDESVAPADRKATLSYDVKRYELGRDASSLTEDPLALVSSEYIDKGSNNVDPTAEIVKKYAAIATEGQTTTLGKARAIYDWIVDNLERLDVNDELERDGAHGGGTFIFDNDPGCGAGNPVKILTEFEEDGRSGGHCTDLNTTFVAMCRASGIPAREMFGIRIGSTENENCSGYQHCWAQFFLPGTGWVFADPGDVLKEARAHTTTGADEVRTIEDITNAKADPGTVAKRAYFFGTVDENRVELNHGRDVVLNPAQPNGDTCNTFGYPCGYHGDTRVTDCTNAKEFVYKITSNAIEKEEPKPEPKPTPAPAIKDGQTATVGGNAVKVLSASAKTAAFTKAANKKSVKVPDTIKVNGQTLTVTEIGAKAFTGKKIKTVTIGKNVKKISKNAFKGSKATKMIVKSKKLTKASVKGSLKGSKIKTVQVKVGKKKDNKKYVKKYKKIFTKKNAGKKVKVK